MRLIDADKLEVISYKDTEDREDAFDAGVQWMAELIDKQPTVDAAPAVYGKIIDGCCTVCNGFMDCCEAKDYRFCPHCGTKVGNDGKEHK